MSSGACGCWCYLECIEQNPNTESNIMFCCTFKLLLWSLNKGLNLLISALKRQKREKNYQSKSSFWIDLCLLYKAQCELEYICVDIYTHSYIYLLTYFYFTLLRYNNWVVFWEQCWFFIRHGSLQAMYGAKLYCFSAFLSLDHIINRPFTCSHKKSVCWAYCFFKVRPHIYSQLNSFSKAHFYIHLLRTSWVPGSIRLFVQQHLWENIAYFRIHF